MDPVVYLDKMKTNHGITCEKKPELITFSVGVASCFEEIGVLEEPSSEEKAKMDKEYNIWKIGTIIATIIALGIYIIPVIF